MEVNLKAFFYYVVSLSVIFSWLYMELMGLNPSRELKIAGGLCAGTIIGIIGKDILETIMINLTKK